MQSRSADSRSSGSQAQLLRRSSSSQRKATHGVVTVPPPQQQQAQQDVQQQQQVQTGTQRGVIVLGEQGWGQRTLAGRLEPLLPLLPPPPQQQQQQQQQEGEQGLVPLGRQGSIQQQAPGEATQEDQQQQRQQVLTAHIKDVSSTASVPSRGSQIAGERPVGLRRQQQQQQQRPLIDLSACGSLASAASSSYGVVNGLDAQAASNMVYNNFPPSPRSPRAGASEAVLS